MPLLLERVRLRVGVADAARRCVAWTSVACPLAGDALTSPSTTTLAPVCRCLTTALVVRQLARGDDLHVALAGAVVQLDEAEAALGVAAGADPAAEPTCRPTASTCRASATVILSMRLLRMNHEHRDTSRQRIESLFSFFSLCLCDSVVHFFFFSIFAQVSRSVTARLKTSLPGVESLSTQK